MDDIEMTDVEPRRQHGDRVETTDRVYTQRVRRLWREYVGSTDSAGTVRMCCSSTDTVRTTAMFRRILKCDNFDCGKSFAFCIHTEHTLRELQQRRCGKHKTRGNYCYSCNCIVLPAAAASASSASLAAGGSLLRERAH